MFISLLLLKNFKFEGEVREFKSQASSSLDFKLFKTDDTVEAKLLFFGKDSLLSLFFKLTLVSLFFSSLVATISFCVAENFFILGSSIIYFD